VVTAVIDLLDGGELSPTLERVAERAHVSERSIFQHFGDREALFSAAAVRQYERIMPTLRPVDVDLALEERLDAFVAQRASLLERVTGVRRAALIREHESETIAGWLNAARRAKAREVEKVFAQELSELPDDHSRATVLAAMVAAAAWPAWESYRIHQGLDFEAARDAMRTSLAALVRRP
jgi:AcrR family transcriptional regulator